MGPLNAVTVMLEKLVSHSSIKHHYHYIFGALLSKPPVISLIVCPFLFYKLNLRLSPCLNLLPITPNFEFLGVSVIHGYVPILLINSSLDLDLVYIFVGYSTSQSAHKYFDPSTSQVFISRHVPFIEHIFPPLALDSSSSSRVSSLTPSLVSTWSNFAPSLAATTPLHFSVSPSSHGSPTNVHGATTSNQGATPTSRSSPSVSGHSLDVPHSPPHATTCAPSPPIRVPSPTVVSSSLPPPPPPPKPRTRLIP
ncbi:hypothetical protein L3X38_024850 [Prunus dulcis]|uniref:Retroviral polymerase SH3-like domain-containing protein n=1 Tax=Prunus dulcis TaxID=3755 RepID=A0AAD4Z5T5_PRUDU|nr:hypothetical protein L3X38_024850 [Prunus dulcis]